MQENYGSQNISELIQKTRHTDKNSFKHILSHYSNMLHSIIHSFEVPGCDYDDLFQEAQVGLYKAVMTYDEKYSSFSTYAYICIKTSVVSYLRKSTAKSNIPQNMMFSLSDEDFDVINVWANPENEFIGNESLEILTEKIDSLLSPYERKVLSLYLSDASYADIAVQLGKSEKSVDNAIQRIRRKLKPLID